MPVATDLQAVFVAMKAVETAELAQYPGNFEAHESIPLTIATMPCTVRYPHEGQFGIREGTPKEKEYDEDIIGVFLIVGKRGDQAGLIALSKQAALWKNRLRDAYKLHETGIPAGTVNEMVVLNYKFDIINISGTIYFGIHHNVRVRYWRSSAVGQ